MQKRIGIALLTAMLVAPSMVAATGGAASPRTGGGAPYALRHRADPAVVAGQQGDDAVGLPQLVGAQHDRLVAIEGHPSILPRPRCR